MRRTREGRDRAATSPFPPNRARITILGDAYHTAKRIVGGQHVRIERGIDEGYVAACIVCGLGGLARLVGDGDRAAEQVKRGGDGHVIRIGDGRGETLVVVLRGRDELISCGLIGTDGDDGRAIEFVVVDFGDGFDGGYTGCAGLKNTGITITPIPAATAWDLAWATTTLSRFLSCKAR